MDLVGTGAALHWLAPPGHISSAHRTGKDGARVGMNITAHQQKKNKETKTGKRKQATDFKEAVRCPSAVVQRAALRKK